jgi:hypothetical protein
MRGPIDPLALHDWIDRDFGKVMDAWSRVWVHGSAEGVLLGNRLVASCGELMELLSAARATTTIQQKAWHLVIGVRVDQVAQEWQQRMQAISVARRDLAEYIRAETGRPPAALFSLPTSETSPPAPQPPVDRTLQGAEPV